MGEDVILASGQVIRQWLRQRGSIGAERRATLPGANKLWGGGKWIARVHVCLSSPILRVGWLAGWDRPSGWQACHRPVSALSQTIVALGDWWGAATGRLWAAGKQEQEDDGDEGRKMRRKRTQVLCSKVRQNCRHEPLQSAKGKWRRDCSATWPSQVTESAQEKVRNSHLQTGMSTAVLNIRVCWTLIKWYNYCVLGLKLSPTFYLMCYQGIPDEVSF